MDVCYAFRNYCRIINHHYLDNPDGVLYNSKYYLRCSERVHVVSRRDCKNVPHKTTNKHRIKTRNVYDDFAESYLKDEDIDSYAR